MTKQFQDEIFKSLIEPLKMNFATKDNVAKCTLKNLKISIRMNIDAEHDVVSGIKFDLTVDNETSKDLSYDEIKKRLEMIKSYAKDGNEYFECCFCKKLFKGYGNNPRPASDKGRCCDRCNETIVIPARLMLMEANK